MRGARPRDADEGLRHAQQPPAPAARVFGALGLRDLAQPVLRVELVDARASRTLMNERSSLNQRPDSKPVPITDCWARMRTCCAASSLAGETHSPTTKVKTMKAMPALARMPAARQGDRPAVRSTVYSELLERCAST